MVDNLPARAGELVDIGGEHDHPRRDLVDPSADAMSRTAV
jgi:hypothetical protein